MNDLTISIVSYNNYDDINLLVESIERYTNNYRRKIMKKYLMVPLDRRSFLFIRTKLYKEINGFDDRYFMYMEDADLYKRVNQISRFVYCSYTYKNNIHKKRTMQNGKILSKLINKYN